MLAKHGFAPVTAHAHRSGSCVYLALLASVISDRNPTPKSPKFLTLTLIVPDHHHFS